MKKKDPTSLEINLLEIVEDSSKHVFLKLNYQNKSPMKRNMEAINNENE